MTLTQSGANLLGPCLTKYGVVTRVLAKMGRPDWHVVEPMPGSVRGEVWIQNAEKRLDGYVQLSARDVDVLPDEAIIGLIESAIAKATDQRYRRDCAGFCEARSRCVNFSGRQT
jgi:hypothetical protein